MHFASFRCQNLSRLHFTSDSEIKFDVPQSEIYVVDADVQTHASIEIQFPGFDEQQSTIVQMIANGAKLTHRWNRNACGRDEMQNSRCQLRNAETNSGNETREKYDRDVHTNKCGFDM